MEVLYPPGTSSLEDSCRAPYVMAGKASLMSAQYLVCSIYSVDSVFSVRPNRRG